MEFNTKQELYNYLNAFDFDSVKDTKLSSVYFLVEFSNHIEPIYFTYFKDVWFASPCDLHKFPLKDDMLGEYVKDLYQLKSWKDAYEYEKTMQRDGWHYEIDCPQCEPFLPDRIKIIDAFSDSKCLDWLLENQKQKTKTYNKLVRDRIPEIIEASGAECKIKVLSNEEYLKAIDAKLDEELMEYYEGQNIEELADLLEVIYAAAVARGYTVEELEAARAKKAEDRGGFEKKILLIETKTNEK